MPLGHTMAQTGQTKYTYRKNNTHIKKAIHMSKAKYTY